MYIYTYKLTSKSIIVCTQNGSAIVNSNIEVLKYCTMCKVKVVENICELNLVC